MKHNWEYKQFTDIATSITPRIKVDKSDYLLEGPVPIISQEESYISGYWDNLDDITPHNGPVIIFGDHSRVLKYVDCDFVVGADGVKIISPKDCICAKFLFHFLKWYNIPSLGYSRHFKLIKDATFPVPSIETQMQIVAELDKINETIEDCRELLRNLDALAQSLFYDFFGDPITNPKGWPIDKLGNLLIIERGGSPRPIKEYITQDEDGINWIKIGDANSSMYISSTKEKIKPSGKSKSRFVKPGDFILSNSMSFGRPYIMNTYGCIHDGWLLLRDNNNFFNKIYLYYCLNSKSIYSEFERLVRTGTVSNLNSDIVRGVKIPVPPLAHQEKFAERIEQIEAQKEAVESTIAELQTLLDSRMDYWFN